MRPVPLDWVALPASLHGFLLVSIGRFGDLSSFAALCGGSRLLREHLFVSMRCLRVRSFSARLLREHRERLRWRRRCALCGHFLLSRVVSECDRCEEFICEDCVGWTTFSRKRVLDGARPGARWVCAWCLECDELEDMPIVPSLKSWVVDWAWHIAGFVIRDYDLVFYLRLVTLAGEGVVDREGSPVRLVRASWNGFENFWHELYWLTERRIRHAVFGVAVVDESMGLAHPPARWSRFLSRSDARLCTEESPYLLPVLLGGWG